jgi:phage terminase large subunit-like protein
MAQPRHIYASSLTRRERRWGRPRARVLPWLGASALVAAVLVASELLRGVAV